MAKSPPNRSGRRRQRSLLSGTPRIATHPPTVTPTAFRKLVEWTYPGLEKSPFYWRLLEYILFSTYYDGDTGQLVLQHDTVLKMAGARNRRVDGKSTSAENLLSQFEEDVGINLNLSHYSYAEGKARTLSPELSPAVRQAYRNLVRTYPKQLISPVFFDTGKPASCRARKRTLEKYDLLQSETLEQYLAAMEEHHPARSLLDLLNSQSPLHISRYITRRLDETRQALFENRFGYNEEKIDRSYRILNSIEEYCRVRYKPSRRTARVYSMGTTYLSLPRELRCLILDGCYSFDLKSAQLAIVGRLWDLKKTSRFLEAGGDFWLELCSYCGVGVECKPSIKQALYALLYGASKEKLMEILTSGADGRELDQQKADDFLRHPVVAELGKARRRQARIVREEGGAYDAFGRWIRIPHEPDSHGWSRPNVYSVLSQVVQSYELQIMCQILPIIERNKDIHVMAWLHDGLTLHLNDATKRERWIRQLTGAVNKYALAQGVQTRLEVELLWSRDEDINRVVLAA